MKKQSGFTLIEILVVISIIALLASVILISLDTARKKSRDAKRISDMNQIAKGLELYFNKCGSFPVTISGGSPATTTLTTGVYLYSGTVAACGTNRGDSGNGGIGTNRTGDLLTSFQSAPTPPDSTLCETGNNNSFQYASYRDALLTTRSSGADLDAAGYIISFCLGKKTGDLDPGMRILTPSGFR